MNMGVMQQPAGAVGNPNKDTRKTKKMGWLWLGGIAFTAVVAATGTLLARVPGFNHIGPLACAIVISVLYRQIAGYPDALRPGIQFSAKRLLRFAIILYGLKLNIDVIFHQGLSLLVRDAVSIAFAIMVMMLLAKWVKADASLSLLLGVGTGVCGAAAIAAVAPIVKAREEDTAIAVGIIAMVGTVFALVYTLIRPVLPLSAVQYGVWTGVSIHEVAQVALAADPAGAQPLAMALLAKLGRVFLLVPLSLVLMYWMKRSGKGDRSTNIEFPWFLVGFVVMSLIGSYVIGKHIMIPATVMNDVSAFSSFVLTTAMVGLGLNVSFRDLRTKAVRSVAVMVVTSLALSVFTFFTIV